MGRSARAAAFVALFGLVPAIAAAQGAGPQAPAPADTGAAPASAPGTAAPSAKPVVPATGYGWSNAPAKRGARMKVRPRTDAHPEGVVIPGFETLADGSSRVFVQMPRTVAYSAKPARGSITYVLKGLRVEKRNNLNALVTVHFNTPVTRARLVPHGGDLWLVVDLRANVQPTVSMDSTKDGGAMLRLEFPRGDYLGGGPAATVVQPVASSAPVPSASSASGEVAPSEH